MAFKSFTHKGYDIWLAALQPSKIARGGVQRSLQIRKGSIIKKNIRYKRLDPKAFDQAAEKAVKWINEQIEPNY